MLPVQDELEYTTRARKCDDNILHRYQKQSPISYYGIICIHARTNTCSQAAIPGCFIERPRLQEGRSAAAKCF
jgi:hypothetical protein